MLIFVLTATYELRVSRKSHLRDHPNPDSESGATIKILLCFKSIFRQSNFVDNTDDISNRGFPGFLANESLGSRVSDLDSLRSLDTVSVFGIRDPDQGRNFMF
jgi:hypothetical protein